MLPTSPNRRLASEGVRLLETAPQTIISHPTESCQAAKHIKFRLIDRDTVIVMAAHEAVGLRPEARHHPAGKVATALVQPRHGCRLSGVHASVHKLFERSRPRRYVSRPKLGEVEGQRWSVQLDGQFLNDQLCQGLNR